VYCICHLTLWNINTCKLKISRTFKSGAKYCKLVRVQLCDNVLTTFSSGFLFIFYFLFFCLECKDIDELVLKKSEKNREAQIWFRI